MAFVKYEIDEVQRPAVKINGSTIVVSEKVWDDSPLSGAEWLNLYWDDRRKQIGLSSTSRNDRSRFTVRKSARGVSVPAKQLFEKFRLGSLKPVSGLYETDGVIAFKVAPAATEAIPADVAGAPRRRGRPRRNPLP